MKHSSTIFAALSAVLLASLILPMPDADGTLLHVPAFCPFYLLTGLPCPGCGLSRAFVCIGHGQWAQSLHWHPLGLILYAVCMVWWACAGASLLCKRPLPTLPPAFSRAACAVVLLTGVGRMAFLLAHHVRW